MSKKGILTLIIILVLALTLVVVGVTLAWYTSGASDSSSFVLNANGFLVVYFDDEVTTNDVKLKPAVMTKPGAISDTTAGFDVLTKGNGIDEVATVSEFETKFAYVNSSNTEEGEEETTVVQTPSELSFQISAEAVDYDGTKTALEIGRDITVTVTVSGEYVSIDEEFEDVTLDFENPISVDGDITFTINLSAYITEPDELCNPVLITAEKVVIKLTVTATSDSGSEEEETN